MVYFLHENAGLIFLSLLRGLVASLAYLVRTTPVYTARAVLEVANTGPSPLEGPAGRGDPVAADSATLLKTVEQSLTGPGVLDRVIATEQLALDPYFVPPGTQPDADGLRDRLRKCVSAQLIRGTRLIAVTAESPDPARAGRLAQALVDAFFAKNVSARHAEAEASRRFLLAEVERQSAVLKGAEERLQAYRETSGAGAFPNQRDLDAGYLTQLHAQVTAALRSGDVNQLLSLQPIADSPEIVELRKQADEVATRLATLAGRYRPKRPAMLEAQRTLDETRAALDRTARRAADAIVHAYQAARDTAEKLQRELAAQAAGKRWCPGQDSNLHTLRQRLLRPSCLPFHHPGGRGAGAQLAGSGIAEASAECRRRRPSASSPPADDLPDLPDRAGVQPEFRSKDRHAAGLSHFPPPKSFFRPSPAFFAASPAAAPIVPPSLPAAWVVAPITLVVTLRMIANASWFEVMPPSFVPRSLSSIGGIGSGSAAGPTPIRTLPFCRRKCFTSNFSGWPSFAFASASLLPVAAWMALSRSPMLLLTIFVS